MKIVFLSHTSRNSIYKVGSYHLSNRLSEDHEILYINNPITVFHGIKAIFNQKYRKYVFTTKIKNIGIRKEHRIINFSPFKLISFRVGFPFENILWATSSTIIENIFLKMILRKYSFLEVDLVIIDSLNLSYLTKIIKYERLIYRATDDYTTLPNQSKKLEILERRLINQAHKTVVTSSILKNIFEEKYGIQSSVISNGIDTSYLQSLELKMPDIYPKLKSDYKSILIYIGSLDSRIDKKLLQALSINNPTTAIVLGGDTNDEFNNYSNIFEIGKVSYKEIGEYYSNADVGILPFDTTHLGNKTRSPMKLYEMLFFGLPVISTDFMEIRSRIEEQLIVCETTDCFQKNLEKVLASKKKKQSMDMSRHDWKKKSELLISNLKF